MISAKAKEAAAKDLAELAKKKIPLVMMDSNFKPVRGINLEQIYSKRRSIGPANTRTREMFMYIGTAFGKYQVTLERIFRRFEQRKLPSLKWTESRILQLEAESRRLIHCHVLIQKFHAQQLLSMSLVDMVLLNKCLPAQDRERLQPIARRFLFEPLLRDDFACFVYLAHTITEVREISKRGGNKMQIQLSRKLKVDMPTVISRMDLAMTQVMASVILQAELLFDRIYRHMDNVVREVTKKMRLILNGRLKSPSTPEVEKQIREMVKETKVIFEDFISERSEGFDLTEPVIKPQRQPRNQKIHYYFFDKD
ncbi:hypothetical protein F4775DRAFT_464615 [Biscogniauxia sp. FL1348]|nr:hypothetical protein F4775DRAFT_464615 [Biscogniauxia sp. FL1348]